MPAHLRDWVPAAIVALVGALLAWWGMESHAAGGSGAQRVLLRAVVEPRDLGPQLRGLPAQPGPQSMPKPGRTLEVRVFAEAEGTPIVGSRVTVWRDGGLAPTLGLLGEKLLAEAATGHEGAAVLSVEAMGGDGALVRVEAEGYLHHHRRISSDEAQVRVLMAKGESIRGRVVDPRGIGISGARLVFHRPGALMPRLLAVEPVVDDAPVHGSFPTQSDAEGYFSVTVPGEASLELEVVADGWASRRLIDFPEPRTPSAPVEGGRTAPTVAAVRAGAEDLSVVLFPVRAFRVRFLDSETRTRAAGFLGNLQPLLPASVGRGKLIEPHRAGLRPMQDRGETPIDFDGIVQFDSLEAVQRDIDLYVQVDGYQPAVAKVPLHLPGDLAVSTATSEVLLLPEEGLGSADVEFALPAREGSARLAMGSAVRVTSLIRGEWWRTHLAEPAGRGSWITRRLPEGTQTLRFFDGLGWSSPSQVQLSAGKTTRVQPEFPPLTGITLDVRDLGKEPVFGGTFAIGSTTPEEEASAEAHALAASGRSMLRFVGLNEPGRSAVDGQRVWQFLALNPGQYAWVFERSGFSEAAGTLTLRAGEIQRLEISVSGAP